MAHLLRLKRPKWPCRQSLFRTARIADGRCDDRFVQDEGWYAAAERYENFLRTRAGQRILFLELGVGYNTPGIIKYPFWRMTAQNERAVYACVNRGEAITMRGLEDRSILLDADIAEVLRELKR